MPANAPKTQLAASLAQQKALAREAAATIRSRFMGDSHGWSVISHDELAAIERQLDHCAAHHTGITAAEAGRRASRPHAHATEADRREARRAAMARYRAKKKKKLK